MRCTGTRIRSGDSMNDASAVWISARSLSFYAPQSQSIVYHDMHPKRWTTTHCGLRLLDRHEMPRGVWVRYDTAQLIANPCGLCWRTKR
jgi:hypothetical protein